MASLMIGMDFYDTGVYLGLWAEEERGAKSFAVPGISDEEDGHIPLYVVPGNGEFYAGHEGIEYAIREHCNGVSVLYGRNVREKITVNMEEYDSTELLSGFMGAVLGAVKKHFGGASIARLCVTGTRMNDADEKRLKTAMEMLGLKPDQYAVINHANAYARYMLNQKEEDRKGRAAAIDFDALGAMIYSFVPYENRSGAPSHILSDDLSMMFKSDLSSSEKDSKEDEQIKAFENIVNTAISKNLPLARLLVTGKSVDNEKIKNVLKKYASENIRIFFGQNLYSLGACYMAVNETPKEKTIFDGETLHSISMEGYKDSLIDAVELIPAGTPLKNAKKEVQVILDGTNELVFHVLDMRNGNRNTYTFTPDDLHVRDNRTQRLEVKVFFLDKLTIVLKVRDIGFGNIYPATFRVWEQVIQL